MCISQPATHLVNIPIMGFRFKANRVQVVWEIFPRQSWMSNRESLLSIWGQLNDGTKFGDRPNDSGSVGYKSWWTIWLTGHFIADQNGWKRTEHTWHWQPRNWRSFRPGRIYRNERSVELKPWTGTEYRRMKRPKWAIIHVQEWKRSDSLEWADWYNRDERLMRHVIDSIQFHLQSGGMRWIATQGGVYWIEPLGGILHTCIMRVREELSGRGTDV